MHVHDVEIPAMTTVHAACKKPARDMPAGAVSNEKGSRVEAHEHRGASSDTGLHHRVAQRAESVGTMHRPACIHAIG